jgi:long-chain acyl-CoA synthetase
LFIMAGSGEVITFREYEARCNRLAHLYRDTGLRRLDHVAFFMENNVRMLECEGAAERTGLYYTCVNSYLSADEVAYIVNDCQARVFVTSAAKRDVAASLPEKCPTVERWLMVDAAGALDGPWESYDDAVADLPASPVPDEQLGAAMLYSSGTTGRPKGILRPLPDVHPGDPLR